MDKRECSKIASQTVFVYLFVEKGSQKVIYVGTTFHIGRRLNEHRRALYVEGNRAPIYIYMRENNLKLFDDVEVRVVGYYQSRKDAANEESRLIDLYSSTTQNNVKIDTRKYNTDPRLVKIKCVETGDVYHAAEPLAKHLGISRYMLDKYINEGVAIHGKHYQFLK